MMNYLFVKKIDTGSYYSEYETELTFLVTDAGEELIEMFNNLASFGSMTLKGEDITVVNEEELKTLNISKEQMKEELDAFQKLKSEMGEAHAYNTKVYNELAVPFEQQLEKEMQEELDAFKKEHKVDRVEVHPDDLTLEKHEELVARGLERAKKRRGMVIYRTPNYATMAEALQKKESQLKTDFKTKFGKFVHEHVYPKYMHTEYISEHTFQESIKKYFA